MSKSRRQAATAAPPQHTIASLVDEAARLGIVQPPQEMEAIAAEAIKQPYPIAYLEHLVDRQAAQAELQRDEELLDVGSVLSAPMADEPFPLPTEQEIESLPPAEMTEWPNPQEEEEHLVRIDLSGIPLGEIPAGAHVSRHCDMSMTGPHRELATTLTQLFEGLYRSGQKLPNNRPIGSTADAVRWLLYRVQESAAALAAK